MRPETANERMKIPLHSFTKMLIQLAENFKSSCADIKIKKLFHVQTKNKLDIMELEHPWFRSNGERKMEKRIFIIQPNKRQENLIWGHAEMQTSVCFVSNARISLEIINGM